METKVTEKVKQRVRDTIKLYCLEFGRFGGQKKTIVKTNGTRYPWAIVHQCDLFGKSSEFYQTIDEAVYDFVELWAVYG